MRGLELLLDFLKFGLGPGGEYQMGREVVGDGDGECFTKGLWGDAGDEDFRTQVSERAVSRTIA